jgi:tRNA (guanine37-N1)-methyltransferase
MLIDVITLFPELISVPMTQSIMGRAQAKGIATVRVHQLRDYGLGRHRQVDDTPCGGGPGMVLRPEPLFDLLTQLDRPEAHIIFLSPSGSRFDQRAAESFAGHSHLIMICGHYEGIDQRVIDTWVDAEWSIGDYVLTNGAIAAVVMMDAIIRLLPGALGCGQSAIEESFGATGLLEGPQYTKPAIYQDLAVPEVLMSGDHAKIAEWRLATAKAKTARVRPDLVL